MLYSNLLKRPYTAVDEKDKCIIDSNELIAKKLESYRQTQEKNESSGFQTGLDAPKLSEEDLSALQEESGDADAEAAAALLAQQPVYNGPDPEELLAEAQQKIEEMKVNARAELEAERQKTLEDARKEGFNKGFQEGSQQGLAQTETVRKELEQEQMKLQQEYQSRVEELEPQFIDTLTGIYEHIFKVDLSGYRDIIVHLITTALNGVEETGTYLVHVSKDDFPYVNLQKREIMSSVGIGGSSVEIIEDISLKKNECLIETEGGIFDCGLGTQLSELTRKLKLLSYEKE